ncbi:TonB-dependent receptor [Dinghuibacter silviterrae]|uniref:Outer membrane receptor protein involved in Fe transport n=1 Tax=Dinghuibacter silviterrae TaxID=1539049 RepID=A0A4R8DVG7_9BACT|nr:TonB-dependent receptor [Dinghuibacter silviterrae]TDX02016.1 outer membrane receptor protein involved in Fe transport [Dinghuibacter silviterrae]
MRSIFTSVLLLAVFCASAQTQTIKGVVTDKTSEKPLAGVTVQAAGLTTITDSLGRYTLKNVPLGRQQLAYSYAGYQPALIPEVLVTSGKEVILDLGLEQKYITLDVTVKASPKKGAPLNEFAAGSTTSFNMEDVTRFAGGRNDPSKLVSNYAGVVADNDGRNDIVVRGNSPTGVLWRINGIASPNPNHFSTLGTTGGAVSALNTNALKTSDFLTGAFAPEYGNALAAVFDIELRGGNSSRHEETFQLNLFSGLEATVEGPLNHKDNGAAYLASYRYSFAEIAQSLGINIGTQAVPHYQDWVFHITTGKGRLGRFSFFGMGGLSRIDLIGSKLDSTDFYSQTDQDAYDKSNFSFFGIRHTLDLGQRAYIKTVLSYAHTLDLYDQYQYPDPVPPYKDRWWEVHSGDTTNTFRFSSFVNEKYNSRFSYRAGVSGDVLGLKMLVLDKTGLPPAAPFDTVNSYRGTTFLGQAFAEVRYRLSEDLTFTGGLHGQWYSLNSNTAIEPRVSWAYRLPARQTLTLSYGLHSQLQPTPVYFQTIDIQTGARDPGNRSLGFTRAHHVILGYERRLGADWRVKAEAYYQYLFDVPVEKSSSGFSLLNAGADFTFPPLVGLVNKGSGTNKGVELTLEKFMSHGYYLLLTTSLFDSRYKGSDGVSRNTAFDYKTVVNLLGGREWPLGKHGNAFTVDARLSTVGGRYTTPVNVAQSRAKGFEVLDTLAYDSERLSGYFRLDTKFGIRLNSGHRHFSQTFYLDLQNVTNHKNIFVEQYNHATGNLSSVYQIGFFPDILYRIQL